MASKGKDSNTAVRTPSSLAEFRHTEGREVRKRKLKHIWRALPQILELDNTQAPSSSATHSHASSLSPEKAEALKAMYDSELLLRCASPASGSRKPHIEWQDFKRYAEAKEAGRSCSFIVL